jgi:serine/threonine protein kinase/small nuclear ribonucleoprotein (snRNP)-like protein
MPQTIGNYEILSTIGNGRIGVVFRARQMSMDRVVALRVLDKAHAENAAFVERFLTDARGAGRVAHASLVQVYEVGQADGHYFCSMEYIDGGPLQDRREPMSEKEGLACFRSVAEGLMVVHEAGITHGQITPASILLTEKGSGKLADLGMTRDEGDQPSESQAFYRAPELAAGATPDERADLYSLGATMYRALAGARPEVAPGEKIPPLKAMRPQVSAKTEAVVMKLLETDPGDRYDSVRRLIEDLDAVLAGSRPVHARMGSTAPTIGRVARARTTGHNVRVPPRSGSVMPYMAGGAGVTMLVLGIIVFAFGGREAPTDPKPSRIPRTNSLPSPATPPPARDTRPYEAALSRIEKEIAARPDAYPEPIEKLEALSRSASGTAVAASATQLMTRLRSAWQKRAETSIDRARTIVASALADEGFDTALAAFDAIHEDDRPLVSAAIAAETTRISSAARARLDALVAEATAQIAARNLPAAASAVERLKTFSFAPLRLEAAGRAAQLDDEIAQLRDTVARQALEKTREAFAAFAEAFIAAVSDRNWGNATAAAERVRPALKGTDLATAPDASLRVVRRLQRRLDDAKTALSKKMGERIALAKRDGSAVRGTLESVDGTGVHLLLEHVINRRVVGSSRPFVSWADLSGQDIDTLAGTILPASPDDAIAEAFAALDSNDADRATRALAIAAGHPLVGPLTVRVDTLKHGEVEAAARAAWAEITAKTRLGLTKRIAEAVLPLIDEYEKQHGATRYAASIADEIKAAREAATSMLIDQRLRKGLQVHFPLDATGATQALDASGNEKHGLLRAVTVDSDGAHFPAAGSCILIKPPAPLGESYTVAGRGPAPFAPRRWHTLTRGLGVRGDHHLLISPGLVLGAWDNFGGRRFMGCGWSAASLKPGWHHFAAVATDGTTTYYVDGAKVGSINWQSKGNVHGVGNNIGGGQLFADTIKDFRLYDRALSDEEVAALARLGQ